MKKFLCLLLTACLCSASRHAQQAISHRIRIRTIRAAGDNAAGAETPGDADSADTDQGDAEASKPDARRTGPGACGER